MKKEIILLFIICCACAAITTVSAQTVSVNNATIDSDETTLILVLLDEAPEGLSGYNITVSLSNTEVANITEVTFPDWAALHDASDLPGDSVTMNAIDLNEEIGLGATSIELGQITIQGIAAGESDIFIEIISMDDDDGLQMSPEIEAGLIVVEGAPGEPTVTRTPGPDGNGGTTVPTTEPTGEGTTTAPTTEPTTTVTTAGTTTAPTTEPTGEGTTAAPTTEPTEQPGFGALLALVALGAAAVLLVRDR
jgi:PGF-CTERM protein